MLILSLIPHFLDNCSFIVNLQVGGVSPSSLLFSLNITLLMLGLLALHINFKIRFLISTKGLAGFNWDYVD